VNRMSGQVTLSTNEEAEAIMNKYEEDIKKIYGGKSAFWRSCLMTYDDKHRLEAKIELMDQKIEQRKKEIEDLKLQQKGLQAKLDEMTKTEQTEETQEIETTGDKKFWDVTVRKIFKRTSRDEPKEISKRWDNWFDSRHQLFIGKFDRELTTKEFEEFLVQEAEERGYNEKLEKLGFEVSE